MSEVFSFKFGTDAAIPVQLDSGTSLLAFGQTGMRGPTGPSGSEIPVFADLAGMKLSENAEDGGLYTASSAFNGEPETFLYDADSTATADGALIIDATGMGVGRLVSTRTVYADFAELDGDTRALAEGTALRWGGFVYTVAASGATDHHLTTAGGAKLYVLPDADGFTNIAARGVDTTGATDVGDDIASAIEAHPKLRLTGDLRVEGLHYADVDGDRVIDMRGANIQCVEGGIVVRNSARVSTTFASNAAAGATTVAASSSGAVAGDVVHMGSDTAVDVAFAYGKQQVRRAVSVSGSNITLDDGLRFAIASGETGQFLNVYPPHTVQMVGGSIGGTSDPTSFGYFYFSNFADVSWSGLELTGDSDFDILTDVRPGGIYHMGGDGFSVSSPTMKNLAYGITTGGGTRKTVVSNPVAHRVRHPVDPSTWADGVVVSNSVSTECYQTISPHPSFNVNFHGVDARGEYNTPFMRSIGGSVKDAKIELNTTATLSRGLFHYTEPKSGFDYLYDEVVLDVDGLDLTVPGGATPNLDFRFGAVRLANIPRGRIVGATTLDSLFIGDNVPQVGKYNGGGTDVDDEDAGVRITPTFNDLARLDAEDVSGVMVIDPNARLVPQSAESLSCHGTLVEGVDTTAFDVEIVTNAFATLDNPANVIGKLRLVGAVRHSSGASYDVVTHEFAFRHKISATSVVYMSTTPSLTRNAVATNSLSLAISSVGQEGQTELGATARHNINFTVTPATTGASPNISVKYELDMWVTT